MGLSVDTLAAELAAMPETLDPAEAAYNMSVAWDNYFQDAVVNLIPAVPETTELARLAMETVLLGTPPLTGLSSVVPGVAAAAFLAGLGAYWAGISLAAVTIWPQVPPLVSVTPPPGLATLLAALALVFPANVLADPPLTKEQSCALIAVPIHMVQVPGVPLPAFAINGASPPVSFPVV